MDSFFYNALFLIARYLHVVCTTVLVGGTLFYEMVVPLAIDDLRPEHQLAIFARARLIFRRLVWTSAALLILSGILSSYVHWDAYYQGSEPIQRPPGDSGRYIIQRPPPAQRSDWWWVGHSSTGVLAVIIAVYLTAGNRPPDRPVQWMRLNLVVLLIVIFLGTTARHVRMFFMHEPPPEPPKWIGG